MEPPEKTAVVPVLVVDSVSEGLFPSYTVIESPLLPYHLLGGLFYCQFGGADVLGGCGTDDIAAFGEGSDV